MSKYDVRKRLGSQLAEVRKHKHWRLSDVARRTGRQPGRISEMETGKANSTIDMMADAADTLGMSLVLVPNDRLEEVMKIIGQSPVQPAQSDRIKSVFEEVFADDRDDDEESAHAGSR